MEDEKRSIRFKIYPSNILCQIFIKIGKASLEKFGRKALEGSEALRQKKVKKKESIKKKECMKKKEQDRKIKAQIFIQFKFNLRFSIPLVPTLAMADFADFHQI